MYRAALVMGAGGRLGEALLSAVVSSPRYQAVKVLTTGTLGSTTGVLEGLTLAQLQELEGGLAVRTLPGVSWSAPVEPPEDDPSTELDVFVCWGHADDPLGRAQNGRDAIYGEISDPPTLRAAAAAACALKARRLLLLAPLLAWQQVSAAGRMLPEAMEMELAGLPIPTIVIMRPTTERQRGAPPGATGLQRFARFYLSQLRFVLPAVTHALRATDIARAAISVMSTADNPGITVVPLDEIRQHASGYSGR